MRPRAQHIGSDDRTDTALFEDVGSPRHDHVADRVLMRLGLRLQSQATTGDVAQHTRVMTGLEVPPTVDAQPKLLDNVWPALQPLLKK